MRLHWPRTLIRKGPAVLAAQHLSYSQTRQRGSRLQLFILDCSASMLSASMLAQSKGVLVKLLERAYQSRDDVALICFGGDHAELRIAPRPATSNIHNGPTQWIHPICGGGGTPLGKAVSLSNRLLTQWAKQHPARQHSVWLISDGRTNELPARPAYADLLQVVDCERQRVRLGLCTKLAAHWQCDYLLLDDIAPS
jgi:magnesium chelatase subunit ChlD-like protein